MVGKRTILRNDQVRRFVNTTAYWEARPSIVPEMGDVYIYTDGSSITEDGVTTAVPKVKVGDGETVLSELPFIDDYVSYLIAQLNDSIAADLDDKLVGGKNIEIKPLVPEDYAMINWAANENSTYINTGIVPDIDDIEMELIVKPTIGSWYILQSRPSGGSTTGISGSSSNDSITFNFCGLTLTSTIRRYAVSTYKYLIRAKAKNGIRRQTLPQGIFRILF